MTPTSREIKHKDPSYRIVGCAQKVHRALGSGFPEAVYHKALSGLNGEHIAQVISYLKATGLDLGILINFGRRSLETKRALY